MPWMTSLKSNCEACALVRSALINWVVVILLAAIAGTTLAQAQVRELDDGRYQHLRNTDISGNDYASGFERRDLRGIGVRQCARRCLADSQCAAFTHNGNKRICFLKTAAGKKKRFRRATSGIVTGRARQQVKTVRPPSQGLTFEMLGNVDLPGFDYRNPRNDQSLLATGVDGCQQRCASDVSCKAFTYNLEAGWCWLKTGIGRSAHFAGAVSGVKQSTANTAAQSNYVVPVKGLTKDIVDGGRDPSKINPADFKPTSIQEIRLRAVPYGGACDEETASFRRIQEAISVSVDSKDARVGKSFNLTWSGAALEKSVPVYLMISFDRPVRFEGKGLYALLPDAQAAFGIEWNQDKTRAIVPFYGPGAHSSGEMSILPLLARHLTLEWSIVGFIRRCQQELRGPVQQIQLAVRPGGQPQIIEFETASLQQPQRVYVSRDADRLIEDFGTRYRLLDIVTGGIIADNVGSDPVFSPTGRFMSAKNEETVDILDTVDGSRLKTGFLYNGDTQLGGADMDVGWRNKDSWLLTGGGGLGILSLSPSLVSGRGFSMGESCRICRGLTSNYAIVDLENSLYFGWGGSESYAQTIGSDKPKLSTQYNYYDLTSTQWDYAKQNFAKKAEALVGVSRLEPGNFESAILNTQFSHFLDGYSVGGGSTNFRNGMLARMLMVRSPVTLQQKRKIAGRGIATAWRSNELSQADGSSRSSRERVVEFGLLGADPVKPAIHRASGELVRETGQYENSIGVGEAKKFVTQIYRDVPQSAGVFVDRTSASLCSPLEDGKIWKEFNKVQHFDLGSRKIWLTILYCSEGSAQFQSPTVILFDSKLTKSYLHISDQVSDPDSSVGVGCRHLGFCDTQIELIAGQYLVFWSKETRGVAIMDLKDWKIIFRKYKLPRGDLMKEVSFSPDDGQVTQFNSDGSFYVHGLKDAAEVLEGRYVDDEVIVWTKDGHYDASAEGGHFVKIKFPGEPGQYSFQQFEKKLRVPGLLKKVLEGEALPKVDVGVPPSLSVSLSGDAPGRVTGKATIRSFSKASQINIYQDGVLSDQIAADGADDIDIDVARLPGTRWVSVLAVDDQGLASLPIGRDLGFDQTSTSLHLLAVGIDEYADEQIVDLNFARADAGLLTTSMQSGLGERVKIGSHQLLTDGDATRSAVLESAGALVSKAQAGDTIVFTFAGHGVKNKSGKFFLATSDTRFDDLESTALAWDDLAAILSKSKARVLVFLDACHSGLAGTAFFATNDDAASGLLANIPSGLMIFAASKGREFAQEHPEAGNGLFSLAVSDVIAGNRKKHDLNGNGIIEISELYYGVKYKVVEGADRKLGTQTPWLARNQMIGDFAVF